MPTTHPSTNSELDTCESHTSTNCDEAPQVVPVVPTRRRRDRRLNESLRVLEEQFSSDDLHRIFDRLTAAVEEPRVSPEEAALADFFSEGRTFTRQERIDLEAEALARYFSHRRLLLESSLSTTQVARILKSSRQTPHDRVRAGTLLAVEEGGQLRFPAWQFDPAGPQGVVMGLSHVLRALSVSALTKVNWLQSPSPNLDGRTPIAALKAGEVDRVLPAAYAVGAV